MRPIRFTDNVLGIIKRGPTMVEAAHVGEPSLEDPKRTLAPEVNKQNSALFAAALNEGKPAAAADVKPTGPNEPPRSDQPSTVDLAPPGTGGTGVGVTIVNQPNGDAAAPTTNEPVPAGTPGDPNNALVKPVGPANTTLPAIEKPAEAPVPVNDIKPGTGQQQTAADAAAKKKPKADLNEESSSKKKKKKGLGKLNPF
jgi:outer membrane protein assembly factor BamD